MNRWKLICPSLIFIFFLGCGDDRKLPQPVPGPNGITSYQNASRRSSNTVALLYLSGDAYQRGYQLGVLMRAEIKQNINVLDIETLEKKHGKDNLWQKTRLIEQSLPAIFIDKMRGIADGSGVDYQNILVLNTHYFALGECASAAVKVGDDYIHIKNLDQGIDAPLDFLVSVEEDESGRRMMHVFEYGAGIVWITNGMNDAGISITGNAMPTYPEPPDYTKQIHDVFLRHQILAGCSTMQEVENLIASHPFSESRGFLATSATDGKAAKFEIVPIEYAKEESTTQSIYMTNYFSLTEMHEHQKHLFVFEGGNSDLNGKDICPRYKRMGDLLANNVFSDETQTLSILRDNLYYYDGSHHMGRTLPHADFTQSTPTDVDAWFMTPYMTVLRAATRFALIMNPKEGHLYLATADSFAALSTLTRIDIGGDVDENWNIDNQTISAASSDLRKQAATYTDMFNNYIQAQLSWPDSLKTYATNDPTNPVYYEMAARFELIHAKENVMKTLDEAIEHFPENIYMIRLHALGLYQKYQAAQTPENLDAVRQRLLGLMEKLDAMEDPMPGFRLDIYYRLMLVEQAAELSEEVEKWRSAFDAEYQSFNSPNFYPYSSLREAVDKI